MINGGRGYRKAALDKPQGLRYLEDSFFEAGVIENQWVTGSISLCDFHENECSSKSRLRQATAAERYWGVFALVSLSSWQTRKQAKSTRPQRGGRWGELVPKSCLPRKFRGSLQNYLWWRIHTTPIICDQAILRDSGFVQRIRLDGDSSAARSHHLNRLLYKPDVYWLPLKIAF